MMESFLMICVRCLLTTICWTDAILISLYLSSQYANNLLEVVAISIAMGIGAVIITTIVFRGDGDISKK